MLRIFIGWDSRFPEPADVLRYSLLKFASIPIEIHYLKLDQLSLNRAHDPLASTEFTYSRFLVPYLCNYRGKALFLDNDMLCLGDVKEIDELDMQPYALRVVQHDYAPTNTVKMYGCPQTSYPRKNWSSMMLMDCSKLKLWTKKVVETQTGAYLHRFQGIPDDAIGEIPRTWNTLDWMDAGTKLIHYTNGGPWFEDYRNHAHADVWYRMRDEMLSLAQAAAAGRAIPQSALDNFGLRGAGSQSVSLN
jgi:lipopolysaccharide biosynthesis glycosyltransferase